MVLVKALDPASPMGPGKPLPLRRSVHVFGRLHPRGHHTVTIDTRSDDNVSTFCFKCAIRAADRNLARTIATGLVHADTGDLAFELASRPGLARTLSRIPTLPYVAEDRTAHQRLACRSMLTRLIDQSEATPLPPRSAWIRKVQRCPTIEPLGNNVFRCLVAGSTGKKWIERQIEVKAANDTTALVIAKALVAAAPTDLMVFLHHHHEAMDRLLPYVAGMKKKTRMAAAAHISMLDFPPDGMRPLKSTTRT